MLAAALVVCADIETKTANERAGVLAEACDDAGPFICLEAIPARHSASLLAVATGFAALTTASGLAVGYALRRCSTTALPDRFVSLKTTRTIESPWRVG